MNILIIDDDTAFLRSLEIVLAGHGHRVMGFCDPLAAQRYMDEHPKIDVLLVDYLMNGMTGEELLKKVGRGVSTRCKTFMMTGHREELRSSKILEALGVRQVLCKPLDLDQLCELVEA